jgi:hypothetical protein
MTSRTNRSAYIEIFLISMAMILLEISYTRVFSFKLYYYFTYLIIGVSLLGIGSGGVVVAIIPRLRRMAVARLVPLCCLAASAAVLVGYLVIAQVQLNAFGLEYSIREVEKLVLICAFLFTPFLMAGIVIASLFSAHPGEINRLYCADLVGAALGCALCVPLLEILTPPGTVWLSGFVFAAASLPSALTSNRLLKIAQDTLREPQGERNHAMDTRRGSAHAEALETRGGVFEQPANGWTLLVGAPLAAVLLAGALLPRLLPDPVTDALKTLSPQQMHDQTTYFSRWSPVFRIDVTDWALIPSADVRIIHHDGMIGSTLHRFNGDLGSLRRFESDARSLPYRVVSRAAPTVLIIGAAGGHEVLAGLYFNAAHITGVELNPVTFSLVTTVFADYTGHLADNERVTLINAEGRSFMKQDPSKYDLILFVAPDSYSAMNAATSGAYVLSESYLYTVEMVLESLQHLADGGLIAMSFGEFDYDRRPNRTARYLGTAREAFRRLGILDFDTHVLLSTSPGMMMESTILLRRTPFTPDEIARFVAATQTITGTKMLFAAGHPAYGGPTAAVIALPAADLPQWYASYRYDVRPITDDSPFFWHFIRFGDALMAGRVAWDDDIAEDATGERVLMILLALVTVFAGVCLLLPLLVIRQTWRMIPYKKRAAVYFAALGIGFMFFEISLMQKLTLFLGYPTYSLTVTLFALLLSTGAGSLLSERYAARRDRALLTLFAAVVVLMLFYQFGMDPIVAHLVGSPLPLRIAVAIAFLAPLGICLGAFMPIGLRTVSLVTTHPTEFVAWSWSVNGFFSVISSVLATILSMTIGFRLLLLLSVFVYLIGIAALTRIPAPAPR